MSNSAFIYGDVKLGKGHFDLPPVLIGTMFYDGQTIVERNNPAQFDQAKAKKRIDTHKQLAEKYKLPDLIEISASDPIAMNAYLEFYLEHYEPPFVLGGTFEAREKGIEFLNEQGIHPSEYIYNTISNLKNKKELTLLKENKIESVVILIIGSENMSSTQRYKYVINKTQPGNVSILQGLTNIGIDKIWIDGGVINLESLAHILETQTLISESLKLPVGTAPNLFLFKFSSPRLNVKFHTRYRRASIMFAATWYSNFIFYGAIEDATECFASAFQTFQFKQIIMDKNIKLFD
ncbi:MAG: Tetrahydromethanopterin S-methyltransferase subunit H [Promethearchaeota archaeon]|nr:MAG: Tetrahydromethanopterin S-methyltransferase subunit H [Candidatus Lokiarchaeota archaeon]